MNKYDYLARNLPLLMSSWPEVAISLSHPHLFPALSGSLTHGPKQQLDSQVNS